MRNDSIFFDRPKARKPFWLKLLIFVVVVGLLAGIAALFNKGMNRNLRIETSNVSVMNLDKAFSGFTVLVISDLHAQEIGSDASVWRDLLYKKNFSAVVLCGDMVGSSGNTEPLLSLIRTITTLRAGTPIFFVAGDDDPAPVRYGAHSGDSPLADWILEAEAAGAVYLDAPVSVDAGKKKVWFVPAMLYDTDPESMIIAMTGQKERLEESDSRYSAEGYATYQVLCYQLDVMQRCLEASRQITSGDLQIAVSHIPKDTAYIRESIAQDDGSRAVSFRKIDLFVCGHYCGGQWCLPGGQCIYMPELGFFPSGVRGLLRINSLNLFISPGLAASESHPLPGRFMNRPQIDLLKFTANLS